MIDCKHNSKLILTMIVQQKYIKVVQLLKFEDFTVYIGYNLTHLLMAIMDQRVKCSF